MTGSVPYLAAGFVLTWGALVLYAWRLESRVEEARRRLERREESRGPSATGPGERAGTGEHDTGPGTSGTPTEDTR